MKKTKKLWVIKELKMDGKIEVEEPYSTQTKVITKARVENIITPLDNNFRQAI